MAKPSSRNTKTNKARASRPDANTLLRADHGLRTVLELHQSPSDHRRLQRRVEGRPNALAAIDFVRIN